MSRDTAIASWLASMSKSELIDECFFWHDVALEHGRMHNAVKDENAKLRELVREIWRSCPVSEDDCAKCPHRIEESDEVWCDIPILMEALGVEVN